MDPLTITTAADGDAGELLTLQRAAYVTEAQIYADPFLPPLTETLDELRAALAGGAATLAARRAGRLVGAVRLRFDGDTCHVGRLAVTPDLHGLGIGSRLLAESERRYAGRVARFELFTGDRSDANLRLYRRHGYVEFDRRPAGRHTLIFLEKPARNLSEPSGSLAG